MSEFRVEKLRTHATLTLSNGETVLGCFFVSTASAHLPGPERVGELLNSEQGFFPFEVQNTTTPRTALFNRAHVLSVALIDNEARRDPGYDAASPRMVALRLSDGRRVLGAVRVYRPQGRDRLSDWTRDPSSFRYVECGEQTLIVNVAHVVEVSEAER